MSEPAAPHEPPSPPSAHAPRTGSGFLGNIRLLPDDAHDRELLRNVHPPGWKNPDPAPRYNLVVIGAGTAGLVSAAGAAGLGARVALVERSLLGGDCLNVGCVPSKALLRAARAAADVREAGAFGVRVPPAVEVDFPAVMERMRRVRAAIAPHDSARRFQELGVDVFLGHGRFVAPDAVQVDSRRLSFARAVIATGGRARAPDIPGLAEAGYLTNETVFALTDLPRRLAVIGGGPVCCELAQAFARFGARVTLFQSSEHLLPREDPDVAARVERALEKDGVEILLRARVVRVERGAGASRVVFEGATGPETRDADAILVGVGRAPNVEDLGLESAGVAWEPGRGVRVDDHLRTTNPRVYAAGDVCSDLKFTHLSDAHARIVLRNALFPGRVRASALVVPWCTYTDPEVGHVGLNETEARERGIEARTFVQELADVDRAVLDGETAGFVKVLVKAGGDRILGATVVARHAGEMLSEVTLAMTGGLGLAKLAETIHPYPTQAEALRKVGDAWNRTRLTARTRRLLERWFAWRR